MAQEAKRESEFKWDDMGGNKKTQAAPKEEQNLTKAQGGMSKEGIKFSRGKPTFKKSEHVGNKSDFPELGLEQ